MTESLKDTSTAVDLVRLRRAMFAAHKESSRSRPEESDCKLLGPSPGGSRAKSSRGRRIRSSKPDSATQWGPAWTT